MGGNLQQGMLIMMPAATTVVHYFMSQHGGMVIVGVAASGEEDWNLSRMLHTGLVVELNISAMDPSGSDKMDS